MNVNLFSDSASQDPLKNQFYNNLFQALPAVILKKSLGYLDFKDLAGLACLSHSSQHTSALPSLWINLCKVHKFETIENTNEPKVIFRVAILEQRLAQQRIAGHQAERWEWGSADVLS